MFHSQVPIAGNYTFASASAVVVFSSNLSAFFRVWKGELQPMTVVLIKYDDIQHFSSRLLNWTCPFGLHPSPVRSSPSNSSVALEATFLAQRTTTPPLRTAVPLDSSRLEGRHFLSSGSQTLELVATSTVRFRSLCRADDGAGRFVTIYASLSAFSLPGAYY